MIFWEVEEAEEVEEVGEVVVEVRDCEAHYV